VGSYDHASFQRLTPEDSAELEKNGEAAWESGSQASGSEHSPDSSDDSRLGGLLPFRGRIIHSGTCYS